MRGVKVIDLRGKEVEVNLGLPPDLLKRVLSEKENPSQEVLTKLREHQLFLSQEVKLQPISLRRYLLGFDLTFLKAKEGEIGIGSVSVFQVSGENKPFKLKLNKLTDLAVITEVNFPYIPTFLAYRELPTLLELVKLLEKELGVNPSQEAIAVIDGQGIAHPRGLGIASHFGVMTGIPSIGCAKRKLWGKFKHPSPGNYSPLLSGNNEVIGYVLRPSKSKKLFFISPGHMVTPQDALQLIIRSIEALGYPPTQEAHNVLQKLRREVAI